MESTASLANEARENRSHSEGDRGTSSNPEVDFNSLGFGERWKLCELAVEADRKAAKGDLYFIRAGKCVKIGHSINIVNRMAKMQADNHEALDCLLVLKGRGHEECDWHERFAKHHVRGEWFRWCAPIAAAVEEGRKLNMEAARGNDA